MGISSNDIYTTTTVGHGANDLQSIILSATSSISAQVEVEGLMLLFTLTHD